MFNPDPFLHEKNILILGFGMEGRSTARFFELHYPSCQLTIADQNIHAPNLDGNYKDRRYSVGEHYLDGIDQYDLVIKSPGIPKSLIEGKMDENKLTSQTEIFLRLFHDKTIGITGTKGKSTTSSLIYSILSCAGQTAILLGNIGKPPLDFADRIGHDTVVIFEMSSHQLDGIAISPRYSVFLNLYEEHLDHYQNLDSYRQAKYNIFNHLQKDGWLVFNSDDQKLTNDVYDLNRQFNKIGFSSREIQRIGAYCTNEGEVDYRGIGGDAIFNFSGRKGMPGKHNMMNIMASVCVSKILDVEDAIIAESVNQFPGLEHRLEYLGEHKGIHFYNDSIATIPEATIEAIRTLGQVDTLILGGMDRGINYKELVLFLAKSKIRNIILIGEVGIKLKASLDEEKSLISKLFVIDDFSDISAIIRGNTRIGGICLLSPAASSYGMFANFEERGSAFKQIAESI
jgi:UDP-N-acetylmuramoylalanine--D-glutamate ligase